MTCWRDGSPFRPVLIAPEFTVYECRYSHSIRVGEAPPSPRPEMDPARYRHQLRYDESWCEQTGCEEKHLPHSCLCERHLTLARESYARFKRKHSA